MTEHKALNEIYKASTSYFGGYLRFAFNGRGLTIDMFLERNPKAKEQLMKVNSIAKLNLWVYKWAGKYAEQAKRFNPAASIEDIKNWFRGAIGEWFILDCFLQEGRPFLVRDVDENHLEEAELHYVTPTIYTGCADYGVDGIAVDKNNKGVVIQVKFWNPWGTKLRVDYHMVSATSDQGTTEGWIEPQQEKSIYFFWLGSKHRGSIFHNMSRYLKDKNCPLTKYNKVVYIDGEDLMRSVSPAFWTDNFQKAIELL